LVTGQLVKGFVNKAHLKMVSSSIPNKYQNVVRLNSRIKSFNSSSNRFTYI